MSHECENDEFRGMVPDIPEPDEQMRSYVLGTLAGLLSFCPLAPSQESGPLCPDVVSVLTPEMATPKLLEGRRLEIRRCPVGEEIGVIQLVAYGTRVTQRLIVGTEARRMSKLAFVFRMSARSPAEVARGLGRSVVGYDCQ